MDAKERATIEKRIIENREKSIAYLSNAGMWPRWPICPVKSHNKTLADECNTTTPVCGLVMDNTPLEVHGPAKATPKVYILNMFAGWTPEQFDACKKFEYASLEEMMAAGWEVD